MVTILSLQSTRDPAKVRVRTDSGEEILSLDVVLAQGIKSKLVLEDQAWEKILDAEVFHSQYQAAVAYIGVRPRSVGELEQWGKKRALSGNLITQIVTKLEEQNLLNNEAFARWWVEQRTSFRPKGAYAIAQELQNKGVSKKIIDNVLRDSKSEAYTSLVGLAEKYVRKSSFESLDKRIQKQKLGAYLARRGVDFAQVRAIIDELIK